MTPVAFFDLILLLMAVVVALELAARRLHMPPAAALIVGGVVLALIPGTPDLHLDPGLALVLFLPPLLMSGAFFTWSWGLSRTTSCRACLGLRVLRWARSFRRRMRSLPRRYCRT
jgi:hypothetical protein